MLAEKAKYTVNVNYSATTNNLPIIRKSVYRRRKVNIKNILVWVFGYIIPCIILAWIILSWADVVCNNMTTCDYTWWNAFRFF